DYYCQSFDSSLSAVFF
nr:immunoglobulin light chain junction region [Macaca mulatta]MOV74045.1 immunoglobulin light chain junction region [Macaca mulatta]